MAVPHESEAPVRGRTGFSKMEGLLASVPQSLAPTFARPVCGKSFFEALLSNRNACYAGYRGERLTKKEEGDKKLKEKEGWES